MDENDIIPREVLDEAIRAEIAYQDALSRRDAMIAATFRPGWKPPRKPRRPGTWRTVVPAHTHLMLSMRDTRRGPLFVGTMDTRYKHAPGPCVECSATFDWDGHPIGPLDMKCLGNNEWLPPHVSTSEYPAPTDLQAAFLSHSKAKP
jgi:hypothetical protein